MRLFFTPFWILIFMLPSAIVASNPPPKAYKIMYKYTDEQNVIIISNSLPPEAIHKGYSILNSQGREQEVIAPVTSQPAKPSAPAAGEIRNMTLLKMYENVGDIKQSKKEKINAIENIEHITLETIQYTQERIEYLKKMIAEYQLKKYPVPPTLNERILQHQQAILEKHAFLKQKKLEKHYIETEYDILIKKFETLNVPYQPIVGVPK